MPGAGVTGVECRTLRGAPTWARAAHRVLHRWSARPYLYAPKVGRVMHRPVAWLERRHGRPLLVGARRGVVLAAGGFVASRQMMREHAPAYRGGLPLGTPGDDGSGIRLGIQAGGAAAFLDRVSVWRFLSPPPALLSGVLVDRAGRRVCDESRYGAAIGEAVVARHRGQAWLLADRDTVARARRELRRSTLWFQRLQAVYLLTAGRVSAPTVAGWRRGPGSTRPASRPRWPPTTRRRQRARRIRRANRPSWSGRRTGRRSRSSTARSGPGWPTRRRC